MQSNFIGKDVVILALVVCTGMGREFTFIRHYSALG